MSHPFGDRLSQHLHRKHGLSQSKLAAGILQAPAVITDMCKGRRLTGPQVRERVIAIIHWLYQQEALATQEEANALLAAAGLSPLDACSHDEVILLQHLQLQSDAQLTKSPPLAPAAERTGPRHNLPLPSTPFVGRETELAQIAALLANPQCRLLTLVGPGGVGKTRLALEAASTLLDRYQNGAYFVALTSLSEPDTMVPAIAASMGYPLQNDGRSLKQQLLDHVREKAMLLVLDNAEHLLAGVTLFSEILKAAPRLRLLVTSREQLRLSSETTFVLAGLAVSDALDGEGSAAAQLFLQTAQRVRPSFTPGAADWPAIIQVCRLVGGMPLGLILAASWIELLTPAEIVSEINHSLDFLAVDLRDLPERHRSLRAIFSTAWQWAVTREQLDHLAQALDSLGLFYLRRSRLHEGIALCRLAVEQLTMIPCGENIDCQTGGGQPNVARCQVRLLIWQSTFQRHLRELEAAQLALSQAHGILVCYPLAGLDTRSEQAQLLLAQAEVSFEFNFTEASVLVEQSLAFYRTLHDPWRRAQGLALLGEAVGYLGKPDHARRLQEDGLALRQELGDAIGIARSLKNLATIARHVGSFDEAEGLLRKCIAMFEELNDRGQMARAVNDLAVTLVHAGKFEASMLLFEECLRIYHDLDLPEGTGIPTTVSGFSLMLWGHYEKARVCLQRALTIYHKTDNKKGSGFALLNLGRIALAEEALGEAQKFFEECLAIFQEKREMIGVGSVYGCLGCVALMRNHADQTQELIRKNLEIAVDTGMFLPGMLALASVALLCAVQGKPENAIELYTVWACRQFALVSRCVWAVYRRCCPNTARRHG